MCPRLARAVVGTARRIEGLAGGGQGPAPPHGQSAAWLSASRPVRLPGCVAAAVAVQRSRPVRLPGCVAAAVAVQRSFIARAGFHTSGPAGSEDKDKDRGKGQGKEEEGKRLPSDDPSQLPGHFFTSTSWFTPRRTSLNPIAGRHCPAYHRACSWFLPRCSTFTVVVPLVVERTCPVAHGSAFLEVCVKGKSACVLTVVVVVAGMFVRANTYALEKLSEGGDSECTVLRWCES